MDEQERCDAAATEILDDVIMLVTDAIAEVLGNKWEGCAFDANPSHAKLSALLKRERAEAREAAMEEAAKIADTSVDAEVLFSNANHQAEWVREAIRAAAKATP